MQFLINEMESEDLFLYYILRFNTAPTSPLGRSKGWMTSMQPWMASRTGCEQYQRHPCGWFIRFIQVHSNPFMDPIHRMVSVPPIIWNIVWLACSSGGGPSTVICVAVLVLRKAQGDLDKETLNIRNSMKLGISISPSFFHNFLLRGQAHISLKLMARTRQIVLPKAAVRIDLHELRPRLVTANGFLYS